MQKKNIRLLEINTTCNSGSTGRIAEEIGLEVLKDGGTCFIASARKQNKSCLHTISIGNKIDILIHGLATRLFDRHGLASTKATRNLIKEIERIKPNIIHLHNIHGYFINYKILFKYLSVAQIPIVWTFHDCWPITGHCAHFSYVNCLKWKYQCHHCKQLSTYPSSLFKDRSRLNYIDKLKSFTSPKNMTLVSVSSWLENILHKSFLSGYPIKVIHNGVDTTIFKLHSNIEKQLVKSRFCIPNKFIVLGVASPWTERKGLNDYIKLNEYLPSDKYQIIMVGLTRHQLKKMPKSIIGIEHVDSVDTLSILYSLSNVLINMTYEDNFPTVNLEAMSCGTPVITYDTGGCSEAISEGTGFVVSQGDFESVVKHIKDLSSIARETLENRCRDKVLSLYNKNDRFKEYVNLYHDLL